MVKVTVSLFESFWCGFCGIPLWRFLCASWIFYMNYGSCYILYRIVDRGINGQYLICKMSYTHLCFEICLEDLYLFVFWNMFGFYFILSNGLESSSQAKVLALGASCASWVFGMIENSIRLVECYIIRGRWWLWFHDCVIYVCYCFVVILECIWMLQYWSPLL